jgi:hypothetical protein
VVLIVLLVAFLLWFVLFFGSLLSQYRLCAAGIGLGTAYTLKYKKGLVPMIAAGAIGTTADMVYGYLVECAQFTTSNTTNSSIIDDHHAAKHSFPPRPADTIDQQQQRR